MKIRRIRKSELNELIGLYSHYTIPENLAGLSAARVRAIWREIKSNPSVSYFVLETKGKIAATCILTITPAFLRGGTAYGLIEHVVTHKDFRRKGFATKLLRHTLEYAWKHGCTEVMLLSGAKNKNAHKMYEKLGFDKHKRLGFIVFKTK